MNELNQQIKDLELEIFDKRIQENELRKQRDLARLKINDSLDPKAPQYSNQQKRDVVIDLNPDVLIIENAIKKLNKDIAMSDIELRFLERKFQIMVNHGNKSA